MSDPKPRLPESADRLVDRGWTLLMARQPAAVVAIGRHLVDSGLDPARGWHLMGAGFLARRQVETALGCLDMAVGCGLPALAVADGRWRGAMLLGRFEMAWRISDRLLEGWTGGTAADPRRPPHPFIVWDGTPLEGRPVLVRCLHGLGDGIQFARYAGLLAARGCRVVVEAADPLLPLLATVPGVSAALPHGAAPAVPGQVAVESMELPHACRTQPHSIPGRVPYLFPPPGRPAPVPDRLAADGRRRVGLVWAAGEFDRRRSIPLTALAPLWSRPDLCCIGLQMGPARVELTQVPPGRVLDGARPDLTDLAATLAGLDLLVTVDSMPAHLAGALGLPVCLLLAFEADWRWGLARTDSPWYPSMRIFRQASPDDWCTPVAQLCAALPG